METGPAGTLSASLSDRELLRLLCREGDRLSREWVEEFLRRGGRMVAPLVEACRSEEAWRQQGPLFWTAVHSTFILGAIRTPSALDGLLAALRWSTKYGIDWAYEALPSIFGAQGPVAKASLEARLLDRSAGTMERAMAVHGLAGIAAQHPIHQGEVLDFSRGVLSNTEEPFEVRRAAAFVLLAFLRPGDRALIEASGIFDPAPVAAAYEQGAVRLDEYRADWLRFYRREARETRARVRQERDQDVRWSAGAAASEPWVDEELGQILRKYEWMLADLGDGERGEAIWVADSMMDYAVRHEGRAPWHWDDAAAFSYLMDSFVRRVSLDDPGRIAAVPDNLLRFVRFCQDEGMLSPEDLREVEALVVREREGFLEAALDPDLRRRAKGVLEGLVSEGIDPTDAREIETRVLRDPPA